MQRYCFTFRSITSAMQAQTLLKQAGIQAALMRTPSELRTHGCGYCLSVGEKSYFASESILMQGEKRYQKSYRRTEHGSWQEVEA